jgi:cytochrome c-type biogenesis protein CcmH/NrfG
LSETEPVISGLREAVAKTIRAGDDDESRAFQRRGGPLVWAALRGLDGGSSMRTTLVAFLFVAFAASAASACSYHLTTAQDDQAQPAQTAQTQPAPAQNE